MKGVAPVLCSALPLPDGGGAPEWLHLVPPGEVRTADGRGPYRVKDPAALVAASMNAAGGKLVLDENHATDLIAPKGGSAPARGWITELQSRADGIWGKVDWTGEGRRIAEDRQYRGVSPVILHDRGGAITAILRASLTNTPNFTGLASLHHQESDDMGLRETLIGALGLDSAADDAAIVAAAQAGKESGGAVALQAALAPIAKVAGVPENADAAAVLAGVQQLASRREDGRVTALQSELATLKEDRSRDKATAVVDAAIAAGRVGLKPVRDEYIAMHMAEPVRTEKLIAAMPTLAPGKAAVTVQAPEGTPENPVLLSQKAGAYQKKLAGQGVKIDFAAAVGAVQEGKDA